MSWRKHWGKLLVGALLVAAAALSIRAQLAGASVGARAVERADLTQTVLVSGRVLPPATVELTSRVDAVVLELLAREGDEVAEGATLARLDPSEAEADVARARAALARTQAASGRSRRIAPAVAQQSLASTQVQLSEARRTLSQAEALVRSGAWPEDRLLSAREAVERATRAERSAELELAAARGVDRRAASASVDEALAALALAEERFAHTTVRAPVAGVLLERRIAAGDTARPGNVLFVLAADGPPILSVHPDERHLSQLAIGQHAVAESDAYAGRTFEASVSFIAPSIDPERGTVEVRLLPTTQVPFLLPNMTVSVEIEVARAEAALVLPASLVFDAATPAPWVWVASAGRLERRDVELGLRGDQMLEVVDGLAEGERVLEVGDPRLSAGDRVTVSP